MFGFSLRFLVVIIGASSGLVCAPQLVIAQAITIQPLIIDVNLSQRESVVETIRLTNQSSSKQVIFATVNEIALSEDGAIKEFVTPVMTDRTNTVTSWLEITRGRIELAPGEIKEVSLTVQPHPQAMMGDYHVFIGFVSASKRHEAEAVALRGAADGVILRVGIKDMRTEGLRISRFLVDRFVTDPTKNSYELTLENVGDLPQQPSGEIIFYDTRGREVGSVALPTTESLAPGESVTLSDTLPLEATLGRVKANVAVQYGTRQAASVSDTTFFYLMPWYVLLSIFLGILLLVTTVTLLIRRALGRTVMDDDDTLQDVALYVRNGHDAIPLDHDIDLKK